MSRSQSALDIFVKIRHNRWFEMAVISIILLSALLIGAKTYELPPAVNTAVIVMDWGITLFFLVEITIRWLATHPHRDFFRSGWNWFDTIIVVISLIPIDNSELAIIGRLIRIFRVLRMVSIIPELRLLLNSLLKALPQLGYVMLFMFIIFYIFAAVGTTFFASINEQLWGDIAISMLTLFRVMTFEDWTDVMYETMAVYPLSWTYFLIFLSITAFALLNMIIGIVVNVMEQERAAVRKEQGSASLDTLEADIKELKTLLRSLENVQTVNNSANSGAQTARSEP